MPLPNKISSVVFTILNGATTVSTHTLSVSNLNHPFEMVFWNEPTTLALGGVKRSNVRAFDAKLNFEWQDVRNQESAIISFLNALTSGILLGYDIRFNVSGDARTLLVLPESAVFNQNYINQIKRTPTTINFTLASFRSSISYD